MCFKNKIDIIYLIRRSIHSWKIVWLSISQRLPSPLAVWIVMFWLAVLLKMVTIMLRLRGTMNCYNVTARSCSRRWNAYCRQTKNGARPSTSTAPVSTLRRRAVSSRRWSPGSTAATPTTTWPTLKKNSKRSLPWKCWQIAVYALGGMSKIMVSLALCQSWNTMRLRIISSVIHRQEIRILCRTYFTRHRMWQLLMDVWHFDWEHGHDNTNSVLFRLVYKCKLLTVSYTNMAFENYAC